MLKPPVITMSFARRCAGSRARRACRRPRCATIRLATRGLLGLAEVTAHHRARADGDLPDLPRLHRRAVGVLQLHPDADRRPSAGSQLFWQVLVRAQRTDEAIGLGLPVALEQ